MLEAKWLGLYTGTLPKVRVVGLRGWTKEQQELQDDRQDKVKATRIPSDYDDADDDRSFSIYRTGQSTCYSSDHLNNHLTESIG